MGEGRWEEKLLEEGPTGTREPSEEISHGIMDSSRERRMAWWTCDSSSVSADPGRARGLGAGVAGAGRVGEDNTDSSSALSSEDES